jgi:hypothetical protein
MIIIVGLVVLVAAVAVAWPAFCPTPAAAMRSPTRS